MTVRRPATIGLSIVGGVVIAAATAWLALPDDAARADELLIEADELAGLLDDDDVVVIDAREAEDVDGGVIPGAVNVPTETLNRTVETEDGEEVPRLVKRTEEIREPLREAGIDQDSRVVIYDDGGETQATRIFWVLDYYGHDELAVLDGGLAAWEAAGHELAQQEPEVAAGDFDPEPRPERHADFEYVQASLGSDSILLCNGLSPDSYEDGSIEGSSNLHATSLFEDGEVPYFRADVELAQMLEDAGHEEGQEFLSFCGSGYMASINYFAARLLGLENVRMYDGSLVDWTARDGELFSEGER